MDFLQIECITTHQEVRTIWVSVEDITLFVEYGDLIEITAANLRGDYKLAAETTLAELKSKLMAHGHKVIE